MGFIEGLYPETLNPSLPTLYGHGGDTPVLKRFGLEMIRTLEEV